MYDRDGAVALKWFQIQHPGCEGGNGSEVSVKEVPFVEMCSKGLHRIPNFSPFKKMLVLASAAGPSRWPLWLFICCSGTPDVAVLTRGHWHFQCSSDTICFLYFLAQRKRLRKQFNREREHIRTSTLQMEGLGCLLFRKHHGIDPLCKSAYLEGPPLNTIVTHNTVEGIWLILWLQCIALFIC